MAGASFFIGSDKDAFEPDGNSSEEERPPAKRGCATAATLNPNGDVRQHIPRVTKTAEGRRDDARTMEHIMKQCGDGRGLSDRGPPSASWHDASQQGQDDEGGAPASREAHAHWGDALV